MSETPYKPKQYLQFLETDTYIPFLLYSTTIITLMWDSSNGGQVEAFESNQAVLEVCCESAVRRDGASLLPSQPSHDLFRDPGCEQD